MGLDLSGNGSSETMHFEVDRNLAVGLNSTHTNSGVVSGTTVRALVLGRFSQKKLKIELKDNAKR